MSECAGDVMKNNSHAIILDNLNRALQTTRWQNFGSTEMFSLDNHCYSHSTVFVAPLTVIYI